ncbi:SRPBCC family protein [Pseudonocardia sp. TRM90224]|uniref:SRPBCC family protein n=1 Tax=Pseudonocardia sp. TRM90224 TaxID=2812678 RepID=UPI001E4A4E9C|nr:SRPBCC family protein [Pseudonocardia sp. TRM90224]
MQLENQFSIEAPIEKAWEALNTPETVAPCFPGATLTSYEGNTFEGTVKVKLGPISLTYKGKGTYVDRDDDAHRVVIEANGRDSRGNGTASATVTGTMVADGPDKTTVTMVTDMTITGRPAQFGRGVISDVADKIIGQFSSCVASKLTEAPASAEAAPAAEEAPAETSGSPSSTPSSNGVSPGATTAQVKPISPAKPSPTVSAPMKSEIDAIDLLDTAGAPVLKRLAPVLGGALLLLIILLVRRGRSS